MIKVYKWKTDWADRDYIFCDTKAEALRLCGELLEQGYCTQIQWQNGTYSEIFLTEV